MLQKVANRFLPAMRLATPDTDPILDSLECKHLFVKPIVSDRLHYLPEQPTAVQCNATESGQPILTCHEAGHS